MDYACREPIMQNKRKEVVMQSWSSNWQFWVIISAQIGLGWLLMFLTPIGVQTAVAQQIPTATPDADGYIYVIVQPNDSMWAVAGRAGISLDELLMLNGLTENDVIQPGQRLIIGISTPQATETAMPPMPTETQTLPPPTLTQTAVPPPPTGICLLAYDDLNRDGIFNNREPLKPAVAITIFNVETVVANYVTDGISEPTCLEGIVPGEYQVTRSLTPRETLTTPGNRGIIVRDGSLVKLEFGSIVDDGTPLPPTAVLADEDVVVETAVMTDSPAADGVKTLSSSVMSYVGIGLLLLGGIFFIIRLRKTKHSGT
jgi:LysM repeat protein